LINAAAAASADKQSELHVRLARFYMAWQLFLEAKGALDLALAAEHPKIADAEMYVLRAIAQLMSGRTEDAVKDLSHPIIGNRHDAPLWRALALAQEGRWGEAQDGFRRSQESIGVLPVDLQRFVLQMSARAALEAGDIETASIQLNDLETIGPPRRLQPALALLRGRIAEKLGRIGEALDAYGEALGSSDRRASTQARLRETVLRMSADELERAEAIPELEAISIVWRGDDTEIEALQLLARLYTEEGRLRDAFNVVRTALAVNSRSDRTRNIQDDAATAFESLFLSGKGDALSAIEALSLFYDFRELIPMGRRGDEIIRRLADRLVAIDLLDQASELLQHQVDKRLEGAARAQVATRLAMIYLMNNKPDRALAVLRKTHVSGFSETLRNRRLLLEARALSELGRPDVALEAVANISNKSADRLRADILWKARRWRIAAEQIERVLGDRWRDWRPLDSSERADVLRAAIGYTLAEDAIGSKRLRERYAAKMIDGPDRRAFDVVTSPVSAGGLEFGAIATDVGAIDTLERFLRDLDSGSSGLVEPTAARAHRSSSGAANPAPAAISGSTPAAANTPARLPAPATIAPSDPKAAPAS
jgi:tetratricopeptide (TPR) repeat protein